MSEQSRAKQRATVKAACVAAAKISNDTANLHTKRYNRKKRADLLRRLSDDLAEKEYRLWTTI